ncbi:MAG: MBL fold metallo-hydrolase [Flavobacteriales bacterium]|nr:MBL fold metallo-hydrolase [Flavobacteriales bacterium]
MKIQQIYTGCLAQGAYYIESKGECAIIDPLRETDPYITRADQNGAKIKYIFETHLHADFVSGHVELAKKSGGTIVYGPGANTNYDIHEAKHGETFQVGDLTIEVLHTPGHTLESSCFLLKDENGKNHAIFTGDTLFIGDVGRPDLAQKGAELTQEDLAGMLYDSLRSHIMPLEDEVVVYPAHGAGSACGKNMSKETWDTLGNQKQTNYALDSKLSREDFIKELTTGILPPPAYFEKNAKINKEGYSDLDQVKSQGMLPLSAEAFEEKANSHNALVLDTRPQAKFLKQHISNSIFIGIDGGFAPWVGALIQDINQPILFVAEEGREEEVITRLSRVGYDNTLGYLEGGLEAWVASGRETDSIGQITAEDSVSIPTDQLLDVRKPSEYDNGHIDGIANTPLDFIHSGEINLDKDKKYYAHCAGGYRSVIFASIMKTRGVDVTDIAGGFRTIKESSHHIVMPVL